MGRPRFRLELPVRTGWHSADAVQATVAACLRGIITDEDAQRALVLTSDELIGNALQHGAWDAAAAAGREFMVRLVGERGTVSISVESPARADDASVSRLVGELRRIAEGSAEQAYIDRLRVLTVAGASGGLGLARVAFEAACRLSAEVSTDGWLRVTADRDMP